MCGGVVLDNRVGLEDTMHENYTISDALSKSLFASYDAYLTY
jgi:hypothetical protein